MCSNLKYLFEEGLCSLVLLLSSPGWEEAPSFHSFQQRTSNILNFHQWLGRGGGCSICLAVKEMLKCFNANSVPDPGSPKNLHGFPGMFDPRCVT